MTATLVGLLLFVLPATDPPPTPESLARKLLDGEGLYTVTGGLKPVSEGFWQAQFSDALETTPEVEHVRRLLARLPLGPDLEAGVTVFATPFGGRRFASAFVAHKPSLRALIARRPDVFGPIGVTAGTPPKGVMEAIDRAPRAARWRAFGLAFGYPVYAVEFFVAAGERQDAIGALVERDFVRLPTFAADEGRFVYAVPKGHAERGEDRVLRAATAEVFARYGAWRGVYLGPGGNGPVELLRLWIAPPPLARPAAATVPYPTPCCRVPGRAGSSVGEPACTGRRSHYSTR